MSGAGLGLAPRRPAPTPRQSAIARCVGPWSGRRSPSPLAARRRNSDDHARERPRGHRWDAHRADRRARARRPSRSCTTATRARCSASRSVASATAAGRRTRCRTCSPRSGARRASYDRARGPGGAVALHDRAQRDRRRAAAHSRRRRWPTRPRSSRTDRTPDEEAEASWNAWRVHRALETLPEHERAVIDLAYFSGLSQSEVAGLPAGPARHREDAHAQRARPTRRRARRRAVSDDASTLRRPGRRRRSRARAPARRARAPGRGRPAAGAATDARSARPRRRRASVVAVPAPPLHRDRERSRSRRRCSSGSATRSAAATPRGRRCRRSR